VRIVLPLTVEDAFIVQKAHPDHNPGPAKSKVEVEP